MKKLILTLALASTIPLAHAGWFEDSTHNANYCKVVAEQAVEAYQDSQSKVSGFKDAHAWIEANHTDLGGSYANADEAYHYAIHYAWEQASSEGDAYTTGYSHCMDALN